MSGSLIEPPDVVQLVDDYVYKALRDGKKYDNSEPLDESGVWSLHRLAAQVYAEGYKAGEAAEARRQDGVRVRADLRTPEEVAEP